MNEHTRFLRKTIDGEGDAGQVAVWDDTRTLTGSEKLRVDDNGWLLVKGQPVLTGGIAVGGGSGSGDGDGEQGPPGPQGPAGPVGPQGPRGPEGPEGPEGIQGSVGADSTVPGPQGPQGNSGPTGPGVAAGGAAGQLLTKVDAADYNTQWSSTVPVVAGGTGATNATQARDNLDAEVAAKEVTNYDSHAWETGSFWSQITATSPPVGGHKFVGTCILPGGNPDYAVLAARDIDDDVNPGAVYIREKSAGVWGPWISEVTGTDTRYVNVTGDTMTGDLTIQKSVPTLTLTRTDNFQAAIVGKAQTGAKRWEMFLGEGADAGANAGSNFYLRRYTDGGALIDAPLSIDRATGQLTTNDLLVTTAVKTNGGNVTIRALNGATDVNFLFQNEVNATKSTLQWQRSTETITLFNHYSGFPLSINGSGLTTLGAGFYGRAGSAGAIATNSHNFYWAGALQVWIDTINVGNATITSDYRIKKDVIDLPGMWDTIKALRPIKYTQAQYTPQIEVERRIKDAVAQRKLDDEIRATGIEPKPAETIGPMFAADDIERWGFVAHELQDALLPTAATGVKDQADAVQSLNLAPIVAALTKALQETMARIEALEAAQATP